MTRLELAQTLAYIHSKATPGRRLIVEDYGGRWEVEYKRKGE